MQRKVNWRRFQALKPKKGVLSRRARKAESATLRHARRFLVGRLDNLRSVRRHIILWMGGVAVLIVLIGLQAVWFQRSYLTTAPDRGDVYAEAVQGPLATLNPLYATTTAEQSARRLIFSSLYRYDTTGHLNGDLARTMKIDPTGKVYTVTISPGVVWQDGSPLTADDIFFTVALMKDPRARSTMIASWKDIEAKVIDQTTIQFTLPAAYAAFPQALTFSVLPKHILAKVDPARLRENAFSTHPIGSGPFTFTLLQSIGDSGSHKVAYMAANKFYFKRKPKLDRFQLHVYSSMDRIDRALRTGEVGAAAGVSAGIARGADSKRYEVVARPVNNGVYAIFNTTQDILKESRVRQALQLATDTKDIRKGLYGQSQALWLPFVSRQLEGVTVPGQPVVDLAKARELLDQAGWKPGLDGVRTKDKQQLKLRVVTRKDADFEYTLAKLKRQWQQVGVVLDAQVVDTTAAGRDFTQTYLQPRNYDVLLDELTIGADPDVFAYWHSRGLLNFANYSNPIADDALTSARGSNTAALRAVKYQAFAREWLRDAPAIGLYQPNMLYVKSKNMTSIDRDGVVVSPDDHYGDVQFWSAGKTTVFKTP